jgi:hypothetical protein
MSMVKRKFFEAAKVKRISHTLPEIPDDCGYEKKFRFNIDMNSNGIPGECIEWCQTNCEGKWGWWFEQTDLYSTAWHNWEDQRAYMSFSRKREAMKFWLAIGLAKMGDKERTYIRQT